VVGKPERKRSPGKYRSRREDNIKIERKEIGVRMWVGFTWPRIGSIGGLSDSIRDVKFLDHLRYQQLLKKDSALWSSVQVSDKENVREQHV
jgi:hypothetical protein